MADIEHNRIITPPELDRGTGERMMRWLAHEHLPPQLQPIVQEYQKLGMHICGTIAPSAERTVALRKLVESKDCAVRAVLEGLA